MPETTRRASSEPVSLGEPVTVGMFSLLVGLMEMVPVSLSGYTFEQVFLAPEGLTRRDLTFALDPVFHSMFLIFIPAAGLLTWAEVVSRFAPGSGRPWLVWSLASFALVLPALLFIQAAGWGV